MRILLAILSVIPRKETIGGGNGSGVDSLPRL